MESVARELTERCRSGQRGEAVREVCRLSRETALQAKQRMLQGVLDDAVNQALGAPRGPRPTAIAPWTCRKCGQRRGDQLRRNGHYRRQLVVVEGVLHLRMPQIVCVTCRKSVPVEHPLLLRRQRLWSDIDQRVATTYLEGCSYRATKRLLERDASTSIGLMTLWRRFQAVGAAEHRLPERLPAQYLGLDELHMKVKGQKRWVLAVRAQDAEGGKHWVGSVIAENRLQITWEAALDELGVSRYRPAFGVISDGDDAIEGAIATTLPGVRRYRCTWHLKHNAAEWIKERYPTSDHKGQRKGLMAAVHGIVDAPDLRQRRESLAAIRPEFAWLADRLERVLERIPPKTAEHPVRTNNLMERGFRECRRRTRPMDGFGSDKGMSNFLLLWMMKENALSNGRDYLREILP